MKNSRLFASVLAVLMSLSVAAVPSYAATGTKSASTALIAEVSSGYTITVPESVTLTSSSSGSGTYTGTIPVNIKGDVAVTEAVAVSASAPTMKNTSNESVAGKFTGTPKTQWSRTDMANSGTTSNYTVSATLTPGSWKGTATFTCTLLGSFTVSNRGSTFTVYAPAGCTWAAFMDSSYCDRSRWYVSYNMQGYVCYDGFYGTAKLTDVIESGKTYAFTERDGG